MIYEVRALVAGTPGRLEWATIRTFDNATEADEWLCRFVRYHGYSITDFTIRAK